MKKNDAIEHARDNSLKYSPELLPNRDTIKQLLAKSRYLLYKSSSKWTKNQHQRAKILFERYPDLEKPYKLCQNLSWIYNQTKDKTSPLLRLAKWDEKVRKAQFKIFSSISRTMSIHYQNILNYFDNRSTNASAESFNTKIKAFRAQFRGVRNIEIFLFKLSNIYA
ncbi:transposase [Polaribacter sp. IC073]|uniref:transposase n=1 Tax=Polaribacter sp. IC073 TaxID=2508540 RepID=UPI002938E6DD|nr:transposase [Polaribacter sp. IC073]